MSKPDPKRGGKEQGLIHVGQTDLLKSLTRELGPLTAHQNKLLDAAAEISQEQPHDEDLAYMARELVQCTLPHRDPGQVPFWVRTNGNVTLSIGSDYDPKTKKLVGYPYGSIPRLILFWLTTEALREKSRVVELGRSYGGFLRSIGLDPNTGGGKRGDAFRVRNQTRRLFSARISFIGTHETEELSGEARVHMDISQKSMLWWDPKRPEQMSLMGSWVELGEEFFKAITRAPVPLDIRALRVLKQSPLALDLYAWATHKAHSVARKGKSQYIPWAGLAAQFGSDYSNHLDFKRKAKAALRKIQTVYPGLKLEDATGGIIVLPQSRPAVATRNVRRLLSGNPE
jgi:hypothetical protein